MDFKSVHISLFQQFLHWEARTCIEGSAQEETQMPQNFGDDLRLHPQITSSSEALSESVQRLLTSAQDILKQWDRYSHVWNHSDADFAGSFSETDPIHIVCDQKLKYYHGVKEQLTREAPSENEHVLQLDLKPLLRGLLEINDSRVRETCDLLNQSAKEELFSLRDEVKVLIIILYINSVETYYSSMHVHWSDE